MILGMFIGFYLTGAAFTFWLFAFAVILGGKNDDLWKPFVWSSVWPIGLWLLCTGRM